MTGETAIHLEAPFHNPDLSDEERNISVQFNVDFKAPASVAGQQIMIRDTVDSKRTVYQYIPAQRRAKLAPELAFDTPNPVSAGAVTFDDTDIFFGSMERYSWKLIGKKEILLPYNNYDYQFEEDSDKVHTPNFINPDYVRWELHRVWVVEAELLPGKRHLYHRRVFYIDEDMTSQAMSDQYDQSGALLRHGLALTFKLYDSDFTFAGVFVHYDYSANIYVSTGYLGGNPVKLDGRKNSEREWTASALEGRGVR